jgi:hypothetical protein
MQCTSILNSLTFVVIHGRKLQRIHVVEHWRVACGSLVEVVLRRNIEMGIVNGEVGRARPNCMSGGGIVHYRQVYIEERQAG